MKIAKVLGFTFVVMSAVPAISAEWVPVTPPNARYTFEFDKSRILKGKSGEIKTWVRTFIPPEDIKEMAEKEPKWADYKHSLMLYKINCEQHTLAMTSTTSLANNGDVIENTDNPTNPLALVRPGSYDELILDSVCAAAVKKKKAKH